MLAFNLKTIKWAINVKAILAPAEKAKKTILSKFGAYVRLTAQRSIKRGKGARDVSRPGQPPLKHNGPIQFDKTIFFYVDHKEWSVSIGGVLLNGTKAAGATVPGILEHGGMSTITTYVNGTRMRRPVYVQARPHMQPAFRKAVKAFLPRLIEHGITREA